LISASFEALSFGDRYGQKYGDPSIILHHSVIIVAFTLGMAKEYGTFYMCASSSVCLPWSQQSIHALRVASNRIRVRIVPLIRVLDNGLLWRPIAGLLLCTNKA
jgi:hypothetical protein